MSSSSPFSGYKTFEHCICNEDNAFIFGNTNDVVVKRLPTTFYHCISESISYSPQLNTTAGIMEIHSIYIMYLFRQKQKQILLNILCLTGDRERHTRTFTLTNKKRPYLHLADLIGVQNTTMNIILLSRS